MLARALAAVRDHEGFLLRGRLGSLYAKAWGPALSAFWKPEVAPGKSGPATGLHLGWLPERAAYGIIACWRGRRVEAGVWLDEPRAAYLRTPRREWLWGNP